MSFQNLKGGDKVRFWQRAGMALRNGKVTPEYVQRTAKVQPMLVFADHVVVNMGGRYGTPQVVDAGNFIAKA